MDHSVKVIADFRPQYSCVCCECPILSIYCSINTAGMNKLKIIADGFTVFVGRHSIWSWIVNEVEY
jgi:hypothetical protein